MASRWLIGVIWNEFRRNEVVNARDDERRAYWYQYFSKVPVPGFS